MKTPLAALVGLFSFGTASLALAQLSPDPATPAETTGVAPVVDTADYVQISALPFAYRSYETEVKVGTTTFKGDSSSSGFQGVSPALYFRGGFERFVARAFLGTGDFAALPLGRIQGGFRLTDLLEVGLYLAGSRSETTTGTATITNNIESFYLFGPYGRLAMDLGGRLSLESEIRLGIGTGKDETKNTPMMGATTTVTEDRSGWEVAVSGAVIRNLTSNLDYTAALEIAFNSFTQEPAMSEVKTTVTSFTLIPLGLRYRF
jgi:hypothetical protein